MSTGPINRSAARRFLGELTRPDGKPVPDRTFARWMAQGVAAREDGARGRVLPRPTASVVPTPREGLFRMISPAPHQYPSGLQPVAATGAGVQFATDPIHWMRVTQDCLPAPTMLTGTQCTARVGGIQRRWVWIGTVGPVKDGHANAGLGMERHGEAWLYVTPRNGGNFSRLDSTCLGWARQCSAGRGNNATRGDIAGQFSGLAFEGQCWSGIGRATRYPERNLGQFFAVRLRVASRGMAEPGAARLYVTGGGNPGHFPKHQEAPASRGATVDGMTGSV